MRVVILGLLLANLAFFGWSHWIDSEPAPRPDSSQAAVPLLKLAREVAAREPAAAETPAGAALPSAPAPVAAGAGPDATLPAAVPEESPAAAPAAPAAAPGGAPVGVATR